MFPFLKLRSTWWSTSQLESDLPQVANHSLPAGMGEVWGVDTGPTQSYPRGSMDCLIIFQNDVWKLLMRFIFPNEKAVWNLEMHCSLCSQDELRVCRDSLAMGAAHLSTEKPVRKL